MASPKPTRGDEMEKVALLNAGFAVRMHFYHSSGNGGLTVAVN
jgi:hypothetical protein